MHFTQATVTTFLLAATGVAAFSQKSTTRAFVTKRTPYFNDANIATLKVHRAGCTCATCTGLASFSFHRIGCLCSTCSGGRTVLFSDATAGAASTTAEEEIPLEVEALDGILDEEEAHNTERPARKSLKKKGPRGKPLSDFSVGDVLQGKVKTITNYGAFLDFGGQTEGLLHISQLSADFVSDVSSILQLGQEVEVRILNIDETKNQVGLTLLTEKEEKQAKEASSRPRQERSSNNSNRRDDSPILAQLKEKGWNTDVFVEGKVVSTVAFGAFVRVDASQLNPEVKGEMDGLVHISALTTGRAQSVTSIVNVDDTVKVRVKGIDGSKVSLSMVSAEDERTQQASRPGGMGTNSGGGNKDWKEALEKLQSTMPTFKNGPVVVDSRKTLTKV